jgi:hypothetical protein
MEHPPHEDRDGRLFRIALLLVRVGVLLFLAWLVFRAVPYLLSEEWVQW